MRLLPRIAKSFYSLATTDNVFTIFDLPITNSIISRCKIQKQNPYLSFAIVNDPQAIYETNSLLIDFFKNVDDMEIKRKWFISAIENCDNPNRLLEFVTDPEFRQIITLKVAKVIANKVHSFPMSLYLLIQIERNILMATDSVDVELMNYVLSWHKFDSRLATRMLNFFLKYKIVPNEYTFSIVFHNIELAPGTLVPMVQWMMRKLKFVPNDKCFEMVDFPKIDVKELCVFFCGLGLSLPFHALRFVIMNEPDKIGIIRHLQSKYNFILTDEVISWYIRSVLEEDVNANVAQLVNEFTKEFNVKIDKLLLSNLVSIYFKNNCMEKFCDLCFEIVPTHEHLWPSVPLIILRYYFQHCPDRKVDKFLALTKKSLITEADLLDCVGNFKPEFLALGNHAANNTQIAVTLGCFLPDLSDDEIESIAPKLDSTECATLFRVIKFSMIPQHCHLYWKLLQLCGANFVTAKIFLNSASVFCPRSELKKITKEDYLHLFQ